MSNVDGRLHDELLGEYRRQRSNMVDLQRRLREVSVTVTSPRREVSVTVDHQGRITGLAFPGQGYRRLAPKELAALIMQTIADAREQAIARSAEFVAPLMPAGVNVHELLAGRVDVEAMAPEDGPRVPDFAPWTDGR